MNGIPIVSQGKSIVKTITGSRAEAVQIQNDFTTNCIVISQFKALGYYISGNHLAASLIFYSFTQKDNLLVQGIMTLFAFISPSFLSGLIHVIGFGAEGIVSHSWAAYWMKSFKGRIDNGSLFSRLQAIGIRGLPFSWSVMSAMIGGVLGGLLSLMIVAIVFYSPARSVAVADEETQLLGEDVASNGSGRSLD